MVKVYVTGDGQLFNANSDRDIANCGADGIIIVNATILDMAGEAGEINGKEDLIGCAACSGNAGVYRVPLFALIFLWG